MLKNLSYFITDSKISITDEFHGNIVKTTQLHSLYKGLLTKGPTENLREREILPETI